MFYCNNIQLDYVTAPTQFSNDNPSSTTEKSDFKTFEKEQDDDSVKDYLQENLNNTDEIDESEVTDVCFLFSLNLILFALVGA